MSRCNLSTLRASSKSSALVESMSVLCFGNIGQVYGGRVVDKLESTAMNENTGSSLETLDRSVNSVVGKYG